MKRIISTLLLLLVIGFASSSAASTVELYAHITDVDIRIPPAHNVDIEYDSSNWSSINSARLSVKMRDDQKFDIWEVADIISINGVDPDVNPVEVGYWLNTGSDWYWYLDVSNYLTLGEVNTLSFLLESRTYWGSFQGDYMFNNARLSVDYEVNAVPVPAALFLFAPALLGFFGLRRKAQV